MASSEQFDACSAFESGLYKPMLADGLPPASDEAHAGWTSIWRPRDPSPKMRPCEWSEVPSWSGWLRRAWSSARGWPPLRPASMPAPVPATTTSTRIRTVARRIRTATAITWANTNRTMRAMAGVCPAPAKANMSITAAAIAMVRPVNCRGRCGSRAACRREHRSRIDLRVG